MTFLHFKICNHLMTGDQNTTHKLKPRSFIQSYSAPTSFTCCQSLLLGFILSLSNIPLWCSILLHSRVYFYLLLCTSILWNSVLDRIYRLIPVPVVFELWCLASLQLPLPGVIPSLLLTELSVASLLASQGGLDTSNQKHLVLQCIPAHLHLWWNLWNSMVWIPLLSLMLMTTRTGSMLLFLFLLLCFELHLLLLIVTPLTIS